MQPEGPEVNRHLVIIASLVASSMPILLFLPSEPVMASVEDYLWISDGDDLIYQVDAASPEVIVDSHDFGTSSPFGATENNGYIFFVDYGTDTLYQKLWSDKSATNSWSIGAYSGNPSGVAYDGEYFWISDSSDDQVYKVSAADPTTYVYIITYTGISTVEGVGWNDDNNRLLVTDSGSDLIYSFDVSGVPDSGQGTTNLSPDWSFAAPGGAPTGIVWDGSYFWSIDDGTNSLYKHNPDGSVAATYNPPGSDPQGLAFRAGVPLVYPTKPIPYLPSDSATLTDNKPYFEWALGDDADNHRLLVDASPPDWAGNTIDVTIVGDNYYTAVTPLADDDYSWKVIARNENGDNESDVWTFDVISPVPTQPTLYLPDDGASVDDNTPYLEWAAGTNAASHTLLIDDDPAFASPEENRVFIADNFYTIADENGLPNDNYSWKVIATNENGENASATWTFDIDVEYPPEYPVLISPFEDSTTTDNTPTFVWENTTENSWLLVDNNLDFSSPIENRLIVADATYTIPEENLLAPDIYYWQVIDTDNNESEMWPLTIESEAPPDDDGVIFDDTEILELVYIAIAFGSFGVIAFAVLYSKKVEK